MTTKTQIYAKQGENPAQIMIRTITKDFRTDFRIWCAEREFSMNGALAALMKLAMDENLDLDEDIAKWQY